MTNATESVAAELRALRARDKVTQQDLAKEWDLSPSAISRWENGCVPLSLEILERYSKRFGTPISEIVARAGC